MRSCGFSVCTFFFGIPYVLYRKMWLLGLLWYVINLIVSLFLPSFEGLITFVIGIIVSIQFKSWYMIHAKEKVEKIKRENPGKSQEQLLAICKKKGGPSKIVTALIILYFVLLLIAIFMPLINNKFANLENIISSYFRLNFWDIWNK